MYDEFPHFTKLIVSIVVFQFDFKIDPTKIQPISVQPTWSKTYINIGVKMRKSMPRRF